MVQKVPRRLRRLRQRMRGEEPSLLINGKRPKPVKVYSFPNQWGPYGPDSEYIVIPEVEGPFPDELYEFTVSENEH